MYITIPFTHHALSPAVALSGNRVRSGIGCVPGIVYLSHPSISTVSLIYLTPLPYLHCIQIIYILHPLIQTYIDYISIHTSNHTYIHLYITHTYQSHIHTLTHTYIHTHIYSFTHHSLHLSLIHLFIYISSRRDRTFVL